MSDANFGLVTILIGNVAINVLPTILADSVMAGALAVLFLTIVIPAIGEMRHKPIFRIMYCGRSRSLRPCCRSVEILLWPLATSHSLLSRRARRLPV